MDTIQGKLFKRMLVNGANLLTNEHAKIDALNVFPVPDGDTGTNMSLTFKAGVNDASNCSSEAICEIAKVLSKGLLMGARGNSGVITSQIFRGFFQGVEGMEEINGFQLANAFVAGSRIAYKAVMRPVEGTILTVVREAADYTYAYASSNSKATCLQVMQKMVDESKASLKRTPELLPVLAEVGVVDSGGAGLVAILEGFLAALLDQDILLLEVSENSEVAGATMESDEYGYCTEFIVRLNERSIKNFNESALREALSHIGNSIVCVQDDDIVKVHVHTLTPGEALNLGQRHGEFVKLKIENMQEQHENIILDSKANNTNTPKKPYALIAVAAGDGLQEMFKELRVDIIISGGQTMNPSTEDFVEAIKKLNAETIFLMPNNSNIILAAEQAAQVCEDLNIIVIPTKTIPQGLSACIMFNPDADKDTNVKEMNDAVKTVKTGQITYAIKDTTFEGLAIKENDYMGIYEKDIIIADPDIMKTTKLLIDKLLENDAEIITIIVGEGVNDQQIDEIVNYVDDKYDVEMEVNDGKQPVYSFIIGVE